MDRSLETWEDDGGAPAPEPAPLHPDVSPLGFLLGTWEGDGRGEYPTIEPFAYREEVVFSHTGRPYLEYRQRTWDAATGEPRHTEIAYLRCSGEGKVEMVVAQPTGVAEAHDGTLVATTLRLRSVAVARTPTAKDVRTVERILVVDGDTLDYELWMGAVGREHRVHLRATLRRVDGGSLSGG